MKKILVKKPILHAVLWIVIYVVLVNIGDAMSELTQTENLITSLILIALSLVLIFYIKTFTKTNSLNFKSINVTVLKRTLFYIPLVMLVGIHYFAKIDYSKTVTEVLIIVGLMIGVGIIEEIIFRGFLYEGVKTKSGVNKAIWISGITFGLGHVVNLLRGSNLAEQTGQIVAAISIGVILALLVAITKSLIPGIVFHIMFNISGMITVQNNDVGIVILISMLIVCLFYAVYLFKIKNDDHKLDKTS